MRAIQRLRRGGLIGLAVALVAALTVAGSEPAVATPNTYTIGGVVTFEGSPQSGVQVCELLTSVCDLTDKNGRYTLSDVGEIAKVYATPSANTSAWIETFYGDYPESDLSWLDSTSPNWPNSVDIHLLAAPTITGTVTTTSGKPVTSALVCVENSTNCVSAKAHGRYRLYAQIPKHSLLTLVAKAPGYRPAQTATSTTTDVKITLKKLRLPRTRSSKPVLIGKKKVGSKLRVKRGSWGPAGVHFTYRWYRNGHRIAGAHGRTYRLTWADWRKNIKVKVVATKAGYRKTVRTSKGTGWIRWSQWHRS